VRLDHPVVKIVENDHILALSRFGLIHARQNFLVLELNRAGGERVRVELHLASIP
jgi:hypothetical protein